MIKWTYKLETLPVTFPKIPLKAGVCNERFKHKGYS